MSAVKCKLFCSSQTNSQKVTSLRPNFLKDVMILPGKQQCSQKVSSRPACEYDSEDHFAQ